MDFESLYHFLFESYAGVGILIGAGIVLSLLACVVMERRTRKTFVDRPKTEDDWSFFDDDDEEEEQPKPAPKKTAPKKAAPAKTAPVKRPAVKKAVVTKKPAAPAKTESQEKPQEAETQSTDK